MNADLEKLFVEIKNLNFNLINYTHFYQNSLPQKLDKALHLANQIGTQINRPKFFNHFTYRILALKECSLWEPNNILQPIQKRIETFEIMQYKLWYIYLDLKEDLRVYCN